MKKTLFVSMAWAGLSVLVSAARATTLTEDFSTDPLLKGWRVFGNTNLYQWDATNHHLAVTWDSRQPNSFFYHWLGRHLTRSDDFTFEFDLRLDDIASGVEPGKTGPLQLGIGFQNYSVATNASYLRGYLAVSDIAEVCYYPYGVYDFGGGIVFDSPPTFVPSFISSQSAASPKTLSPYYVLELPTNVVMHITMAFTASNQTAVLTATTNGVPLGPVPSLVLNSPTNSNFTATNDYDVDVFSITSYTSIGDDYSSLLAHGVLANLQIKFPSPALNLTGAFSNGIWQVQFDARTNWLYTLERTTNFVLWTSVSPILPGTEHAMTLQDTNVLPPGAFYRVRAEQP